MVVQPCINPFIFLTFCSPEFLWKASLDSRAAQSQTLSCNRYDDFYRVKSVSSKGKNFYNLQQFATFSDYSVSFFVSDWHAEKEETFFFFQRTDQRASLNLASLLKAKSIDTTLLVRCKPGFLMYDFETSFVFDNTSEFQTMPDQMNSRWLNLLIWVASGGKNQRTRTSCDGHIDTLDILFS